jgi:hypothetical protein
MRRFLMSRIVLDQPYSQQPRRAAIGADTIRLDIFTMDAILGNSIHTPAFESADGRDSEDRTITELAFDPVMGENSDSVRELLAGTDPSDV